jgi:hypothetical protein
VASVGVAGEEASPAFDESNGFWFEVSGADFELDRESRDVVSMARVHSRCD